MLPTYEDLLKDPAASSFAKDIIRAAQSRDPVDVANDLDMLAAMASYHAKCNKDRFRFNFPK